MTAASAGAPPPAPPSPVPDTGHPLHPLWLRVQEALQALPLYFDSKTTIEGVEAGDLFSLNSVLGSTIEVQVVSALNRIRDTWDPPAPGSTVGQYAQYGFVRMPQSYPDVRLQRAGDPSDVLLGLELKGWYLLSKEREPSYRFKAAPLAASEWDLLVVVPWYLSNVLSGTPVVLEPYVSPARWAAQYRNWHWEWERGNPRGRPQSTRGVRSPAGVVPPPPYPTGKSEMSDKPVEDRGDNFGRFSRAGIMDAYIARLLEVPVSGIAAGDWIRFFTVFTESRTRDEITTALRTMAASAGADAADGDAVRALAAVRDLLAAVGVAEAGDEEDPADAGPIQTALAEARAQLERRVLAAVRAGVDVRDVARASGLTPTKVGKLVAAVDADPSSQQTQLLPGDLAG